MAPLVENAAPSKRYSVQPATSISSIRLERLGRLARQEAEVGAQKPAVLFLVAALTLAPHHLTYYAQDLATVFHSFYKQCRVVSQNEALTKSRLKLVSAAKIVLAKTLHLMGMNAPEKM